MFGKKEKMGEKNLRENYDEIIEFLDEYYSQRTSTRKFEPRSKVSEQKHFFNEERLISVFHMTLPT